MYTFPSTCVVFLCYIRLALFVYSYRLDTQLREYRESEWAAVREETDELSRSLGLYNLLELITKLEDFVARLKSLAVEVSIMALFSKTQQSMCTCMLS